MNPTFRSLLPLHPLPFSVGHSDKILCMGSCFAQHIGRRLQAAKFDLRLNPFGILYNPASLQQGLRRLTTQQPFGHQDLFEHQGQWHSFAHHSHFSALSAEAALEKINDAYEQGQQQLQSAQLLILTWGSARVFRHLASYQIVGNCHKLPAQAFTHELLSVAAITESWTALLDQLRRYNPGLQVLLSISPVRHLRDGLIANQRSKATLLLAAAQLEAAYDFVHYFPAYELLLDDLRDYRFYAEDLAHPNQLAVNYIWEYFKKAALKEESLALLPQIERVQAAAAHRPFQPQSPQHQAFIAKQLARIAELEQQYNFLDFSPEKQQLRSTQSA
ncbi:MAG: GSCFA domain-containing protein [Bacteroidota bacterium]